MMLESATTILGKKGEILSEDDRKCWRVCPAEAESGQCLASIYERKLVEARLGKERN